MDPGQDIVTQLKGIRGLYPELELAKSNPIYIHRLNQPDIRILDIKRQRWTSVQPNKRELYDTILEISDEFLPRDKIFGYYLDNGLYVRKKFQGHLTYIVCQKLQPTEIINYLSQFDIHPSKASTMSQLCHYLSHALLVHEQMIF